MDIIDKYNKSLEDVYKYFDYEENWIVFPIDDRRNSFWRITENDEVYHALTEEDLKIDDECDYYADQIYRSRYCPNPIIEKEELTAIMVDNGSRNRFFAIFDNKLKLK